MVLNTKFFMHSTENGHNGGMVNLRESQFTHLQAFADNFNTAKRLTRLNAAGSINPSVMDTARKLLWIAASQHEEMRQASPQRYLLEMSEYSDLLQLRTNRKGLADLLGKSERTIHNHIKLLKSAIVDGHSLIARTATASNRREVAKDDRGRAIAITYKPTKDDDGKVVKRGDWIIWVSKQAFAWNFDTATLLNAAIDNQCVTKIKRQNLPGSVPLTLEETLVSESITKGKYGASQPIDSTQQSCDGNLKKETRVREAETVSPGGGGGAHSLSAEVSDFFGHVGSKESRVSENEENRLLGGLKHRLELAEKRTPDTQTLPGTSFRAALVAILMAIYRFRLFPRVGDAHWKEIERPVMDQLSLWIGAVQSGYLLHDKTIEVTEIEAFRQVRRGILKVHESMQKHPERYTEGSLRTSPLKFLYFDRKDSGFSFEKSMQFVKTEEAKRNQRIDHSNRLYQWQVPFAKKEQLVTAAYRLLATDRNPDKFIEHAHLSFATLRQTCDQMNVPAKVRTNLMNSYVAEISAVKAYLEQQAGRDYSIVLDYIAAFREQQFAKAS